MCKGVKRFVELESLKKRYKCRPFAEQFNIRKEEMSQSAYYYGIIRKCLNTGVVFVFVFVVLLSP